MIPGTVHASLVIIFTWLVNLLFTALGIDLGGEIATQLAQIIVAYILSLLGLGLFNRAVGSRLGVMGEGYSPPFM